MADSGKKKLLLATVVYWVLLLYVIAALGWWAYELLEQTTVITTLEKSHLAEKNIDHSSAQYLQELAKIERFQKRSVYKYVGEGLTFLLLILIGAVFIYRYVRNQFRLHQQQQNFVMAVTHELKTPIAVSKLNLETLQKYDLDEDKKRKLLQTTLQETVRLDGLINNILISSQLEVNSYRLQKEKLNLSSIVNEVANQFRNRYSQRQLITQVQESVFVEGDLLLLKLLLSNLLENAGKYSPADKPVKLELKENENIEIIVTDEGIGIPPEERKNIFKKFYRLGSESTRRTQGTGLGLFICKKIAQDHGGSISVKENKPEGSKFMVQLPPLNDRK